MVNHLRGASVLFCLVVFISLFSVSSYALDSCTVKNSACTSPEVDIFHMYSDSNAHAEKPDQTNYDWYVCCTGGGLGNTCSGEYATVLRLSDPTNAHVEQNTESTPEYDGNDVCISGPGAVCEYDSDCSNLGADYICVASISDVTNAHVGDCDAYSIKVCCSLESCSYGIDPPEERDCGFCDQGTQTRTCQSDGTWSDWSECSYVPPVPCDPAEPCCDDSTCNILSSGTVCDSRTAYRCNPPGCGSDVEQGTQERQCDGVNTACPQEWIDVGTWSFVKECGTQEFCTLPDPPLTEPTCDYDPSACDNTPPTTTIDPDGTGGWTTGNVDYILSCNDDISGCANTYHTVVDDATQDCPPTPYGTGTEGTVTCGSTQTCNKKVCFYSDDNIGNTESVKESLPFQIDNQAPEMVNAQSTTHLDPNIWYSNSDPEFTYSGQDAGSGIAGYSIEFDQIPLNEPDDTVDETQEEWSTTGVDSGIWYFHVKAIDNGGAASNPMHVKIQVDTTPPQAMINGTDPMYEVGGEMWTMGSFNVEWNVTEEHSGPASFQVQKNSANWRSVTGDVFSAQDGGEDGETIQYRVRATDNAGNQQPAFSSQFTVSVDGMIPTCTMEPLPEFVGSAFTISWNADDGDGSGIASTEIEWSPYTDVGDEWWNSVFDGGLCTLNPDNRSAECTNTFMSVTDPTYFRCRATDNVGNEGENSEPVETGRDGLQTSEMEPLPKWMGFGQPQWSPAGNEFTISWSGTFDGAPIACYNVKWTNRTPDFGNPDSWYDVLNETGGTCLPAGFKQAVFDAGGTGVVDGTNYTFMVRSVDILGDEESWPASGASAKVASTTVDILEPDVWMVARNATETGEELGQLVDAGSVEKIVIEGNATDSTSGIKNNTIVVHIMEPAFETWKTKKCPQAGPGEISTCVSEEIMFGENTQIEYRVEATDRAENKNSTKWSYIVTHPLANFAVNQVFLTLGASHKGKILVRNLEEQAENVTLVLSSGYDFAWFLNEDGEKTRSIVVPDLPPGERASVDFEIVSSEPGDYELTIEAYTGTEGDKIVEDKDTMKITVGYPSEFPGLEGWAVLMLILLAGTVFYRRI